MTTARRVSERRHIYNARSGAQLQISVIHGRHHLHSSLGDSIFCDRRTALPFEEIFMRKACWYALWPLALGACSLSQTDNTVPSSAVAGATQTSTSGAGGRSVGASGGLGEGDASRGDASGGGND